MKIIIRNRFLKRDELYLISKQPIEIINNKIDFLNNRLHDSNKIVMIEDIPKFLTKRCEIESDETVIKFLGYNYNNKYINISIANFIESNSKYKLFFLDTGVVIQDNIMNIESKIACLVKEEFKLYITNYNSHYFKILDNRIGKEEIFKLTRLNLPENERLFILKDFSAKFNYNTCKFEYDKEKVEKYIDEGLAKYKKNISNIYETTETGKILKKYNL